MGLSWRSFGILVVMFFNEGKDEKHRHHIRRLWDNLQNRLWNWRYLHTYVDRYVHAWCSILDSASGARADVWELYVSDTSEFDVDRPQASKRGLDTTNRGIHPPATT